MLFVYLGTMMLQIPDTSMTLDESITDTIKSGSLTIPGKYWVDPYLSNEIALEHDDTLLFHGVVSGCRLTWSGGISTTELSVCDMTHRLSHMIVPVLPADISALGMSGRLTFAADTAGNIVKKLLIGTGIFADDSLISAGVPYTNPVSFTAGATRYDAIRQLADASKYVFCMIPSKLGAKRYRSSAYFGTYEGLYTLIRG